MRSTPEYVIHDRTDGTSAFLELYFPVVPLTVTPTMRFLQCGFGCCKQRDGTMQVNHLLQAGLLQFG